MNVISFEGYDLKIFEHNGKSWLRASDIAKALGYAKTDRLTRVFAKHRSEFSPSMTTVVETPVSGFSGITTEVRLFSLRGAHLLGMFSRTLVGVRFRRWVLDKLEEIEVQGLRNRSLMHEWFEAKAKLEGQERFASFCGKGLSQHKNIKPPLKERIMRIAEQMQPSLFIN